MERCPHCNSTSTKTLPMLYGSGSRTSSSLWVTSRGRIGSRGGSSQTRLAAAASPPRAPSIVLGFIGMLIVSVIVWILLANLIAPVARLIPNARQAAAFQTLAPLFMLGVVVVIFFGWLIRHRGKKEAVFASTRVLATNLDVSKMRRDMDVMLAFNVRCPTKPYS